MRPLVLCVCLASLARADVSLPASTRALVRFEGAITELVSDGRDLYFVATDHVHDDGLYRVSVQGGPVERLLTGFLQSLRVSDSFVEVDDFTTGNTRDPATRRRIPKAPTRAPFARFWPDCGHSRSAETVRRFWRLASDGAYAYGVAKCGSDECLWRVPRDCSALELMRRLPLPLHDVQLAVDDAAVYVSITEWRYPAPPPSRILKLPKR